MENKDRLLRPFDNEPTENPLEDPEKTVTEWAAAYTPPEPEEAPTGYELPAEVEEWVANHIQKMDDINTSYDEYMQLNEELENRLQEPEYKLALLRRENRETNETDIENLEKQLRKRDKENQPPEPLPETPPRNLLTHFVDTANAMAAIEGEMWARGQSSQYPRDYSLIKALHFLKGVKEREASGEETSLNDYMTIYGDGGFHRWAVRPDGSIEYSYYHGPTDADKVERLGFKILR